MHYIFGGGNDSRCLPKILNEEKSDSSPHVRDLICGDMASAWAPVPSGVSTRSVALCIVHQRSSRGHRQSQ